MSITRNSIMTKDNKPLNLVIIGQGAIGLLWYSHFYKNLDDGGVYLLKHGKNNKQQTISFTDINNHNEEIPRQEVTIDGLASAKTILICVKCYQIDQVIQSISPHLNNHTKIILCHNGMGGLSELSQALLIKHNVLTLLTTHGSLKMSSSMLKHTGLGQSDLGYYRGNITTSDRNKLIQAFNTALPTTAWCENIKEKQWLKLAINCVINPLTAIYNIDNGQVLAVKFEETINEVLHELIAVAQCEGVHFNFKSLKNKVLEVAYKTAKNSSSMRCDVLAKRSTEIAHINGYIQKLGIQYDIKTPTNDSLIAQIQPLYLGSC